MTKQASVLLTKRVVDAAAANGRRYHIWDSDLSGFGLRVEKTGVKSFIARYRADGGGRSAAQRFVSIGRFGALTVELARRQAKTILGAAATGKDPAAELRAKRKEMKMTALIDLYEKEGCFIQRGKRQGEPMKPRTKDYTIARLRHHVVPLLGHKKAPEINAGDIEKFVADVTAGKTARDEKVGYRKRLIVRGGAGAARKVVRDLSAVFSFAHRREIVSRNPCDTAAVRKTDNQNERFLVLDEITVLGKALQELQDEGVNPKAINIARLWVVTGFRRDEIAALKWPEIDYESGLFRLDDSKTGKSIRPLSLTAAAILKSIPKEDGSEYVFPAERGDSFYQGTKTVWAKAIKKANLPGVTPHTLRHTMGSTATSTGEALALTGAILGHANVRSTAIYAHVQNDPSIQAANRVSKKIAAALSGKATGTALKTKKLSKRGNAALDNELVRTIMTRLAESGAAAAELRSVLIEAVGLDLSDRKAA